MILGNPLLDDLNEFLGLRHNLLRLSLSRDKGVIVINHVPFSPTSVEVIAVGVRGLSNREPNHIEGDPVVSSADDAIASACNGHFCGLKCCIVGVAKRLSADAASRDASARSRWMTARSLSSSFFDVLWC